MSTKTRLFNIGQAVMTRGVVADLKNGEGFELLLRHASGDFGDLGEEDTELNWQAIKTGNDRIFSAYNVGDVRYYVITEWDRSVTTILRADEY